MVETVRIYGGRMRIYWTSCHRQPTMGGPAAWWLGGVATSPHVKKQRVTKCYTRPRTWRTIVNTVFNDYTPTAEITWRRTRCDYVLSYLFPTKWRQGKWVGQMVDLEQATHHSGTHCASASQSLSYSVDKLCQPVHTRVYPKISGLTHNEIYAYNNKHSLRSNTKDYGGKTH
jgi:hypothetical protein